MFDSELTDKLTTAWFVKKPSNDVCPDSTRHIHVDVDGVTVRTRRHVADALHVGNCYYDAALKDERRNVDRLFPRQI